MKIMMVIFYEPTCDNGDSKEEEMMTTVMMTI